MWRLLTSAPCEKNTSSGQDWLSYLFPYSTVDIALSSTYAASAVGKRPAGMLGSIIAEG